MATTTEPGHEGAHLDALRRRLYRPDATDADLREYLAERVAATPGPEQEAAEPPPRPSHRVPLILAGVGAAVVAVVVVGAVGLRQAEDTALPAVPTAAASSAPTAAPSEAVVDVGDGQVLTLDGVAPTRTAVGTTVRDRRVIGRRFEGRGNAVVRLDPPVGSWDGGRVSVQMTSNGPSPVAWRALLRVTRTDWTTYPVVLARGLVPEQSGAAVPSTFLYPRNPPTEIAVAAGRDVPWTLVVGIAGGLQPASP